MRTAKDAAHPLSNMSFDLLRDLLRIGCAINMVDSVERDAAMPSVPPFSRQLLLIDDLAGLPRFEDFPSLFADDVGLTSVHGPATGAAAMTLEAFPRAKSLHAIDDARHCILLAAENLSDHFRPSRAIATFIVLPTI